jgi:N-glycosylase/DNA lyase
MRGKEKKHYYDEAVRLFIQSWHDYRKNIEKRLQDFRQIGKAGSDEEIFAELAFCLFTPQSKAKSCWIAVNTLINKQLLLTGTKEAIAKELNIVRFRNNKAGYVVAAREQFSSQGTIKIKALIDQFASSTDAREWLVHHVKGLGYKEASHFLRNIGRGEDIAILDRHILKNLQYAGVITRIPASLSRKEYLSIEKKMQQFAQDIAIPLSHIDLLMWCKETGEIFK